MLDAEVPEAAEPSVHLAVPMCCVSGLRQLLRHPRHAKVNVIVVIPAQLLAVMDWKAASQERPSRWAAVPVGVWTCTRTSRPTKKIEEFINTPINAPSPALLLGDIIRVVAIDFHLQW